MTEGIKTGTERAPVLRLNCSKYGNFRAGSIGELQRFGK